jgi:hypothetical protein
MAQAGLLGGIVDREEYDQPKPSDDSPSQSVGLLSGVGGIAHDKEGESNDNEGTNPLLLAGIGGISARNQGASQLALRDSMKDDDSSDADGESEAGLAAEAEVGFTIFFKMMTHVCIHHLVLFLGKCDYNDRLAGR